jgi:hypothetical protein
MPRGRGRRDGDVTMIEELNAVIAQATVKMRFEK